MADNFTISKTSGYVNVTIFSFNTNSLQQFNYVKYLWDFGDSSRSRLSNPTHSYNNSGYYTVTLNAYKANGSFDVYQDTVEVKLLLNESIYFDILPPPTYAGHYNKYPFKINITSSSTNEHYIDLYAANSKSYAPQEPTNKWSFLRPEWKFVDLNGNVINKIKTTDTIIKVNNNGRLDRSGMVAGVTGTAEFYFIDDIYNTDLAYFNKPYTTIIATLQTLTIKSFQDKKNQTPEIESFSNSLVQTAMPHLFLYREPDYLKITENGAVEHRNPKWTNTQIPIIITPSNKQLEYHYDLYDGNGIKPYNPDFYFLKNLPDDSTSSIINIDVGSDQLSSSFYPTPINFKYKDDTGYIVSGYYKGNFTIQTSSLNALLTSNAFLSLNFYNYDNYLFWLSNQMAGTLHIGQYNEYNNTNKLLLSKNNFQEPAFISTIETPIKKVANFTTQSVDITGFNGLKCISALQNPYYQAWGVDSELNSLYRFSSRGSVLCLIDIDKLLNKKYTTPYYSAIDGDRNIWVTLYNTTSTLKFNSVGKLLFGVSPINEKTLDLNNSSDLYKWIYDSQYYPLTSTQIENFITPTCVDTDIYNNAWITYSNPFSSFLVKVSSTGNLINTISLSISSCPNEIVCDKDENIWLSLSNNIYGISHFLQKRDTNGKILSCFGPFNKINNLTIDYDQNLWFTHSYSYIGSIKTDGTLVSYAVPLTGIYSKIPDSISNDGKLLLNVEEPALNGIAYDGNDNILVVNSLANKIEMFSIKNQKFENFFNVNPKGFNIYPAQKDELITIDKYKAISNYSAKTEIEYHPWLKSINMMGDWTGCKWINKYKNNSAYTISKTLTGESRIIDFYDKNPYEIFKINEDYDFTENLKSLAFTPSLRESVTLFDDFLKNIYGLENHYDLGVTAYEKVSNFLKNNSDIDVCGIKALYDIAESVDQNSDDYRINYPIAIKRLMDLTSINKSKLWGALLNDNYFVDLKNVGIKLDTSTYYVTAGIPVLLHSKSLRKYKYIKTGLIDNEKNYSLNTLSEFLKITDEFNSNFYNYYSFVQTTPTNQIEGVIDWNNINTTLQYNMSSLNSWLMSEGIVETSFNYELYKGLGFLD
jgi:hypothetical protein